MSHRTALFASFMLLAGATAGAQSPASDSAAQSSAESPATPASPAASPTAPAPPTTPSSTAAGSKSASSATDASSDPSPEIIKEARREGFKPKKRDGVTKFCYSDATLGTRFVTEKCVDETGLRQIVQQREDQRNLLRQPGACSGSNCNGH